MDWHPLNHDGGLLCHDVGDRSRMKNDGDPNGWMETKEETSPGHDGGGEPPRGL